MSDLPSLTPAPCPECGILRAALEEARQEIAQLQAEIRELRSQLQRNSSNSSSPPSLDPPGAPKPVVKAPTGRKPGGQPGHPGHHRHRLPPERVTDVVPFVPTVCAHCQAPLPHNPAPGDPEPTWHQVAEVPVLAAVITEYQGHARTCPCCGHTTRAEIPPEIRAHVVGPNLAAILSSFSGRHRLGKRGIEELVETVFEVPIPLGMVTTLESEMSAALAPAHDEAKDEVRAAAVKNADETGWKPAGRRCWLWMAATATVAYFVIHARRNVAGLQALLGEAIQGIVGSDRWGAYNKLPLHQRQICWAHLKRDFQKLIDRGGPAEAIGRVGMDVVECLFADWWAFRRGDLDRAGLQARLDPMARALQEALEQGCGCADPKAVAFCENVLALYPALWLFAAVEGVEPTNNHAERLLRLGVLWRKNAFGSHSEAGCQFAARMLTVVQTLRLQKRPVLDYLRRAMIAHRSGLPAPQLLGQMGN